MRPKRPAFPVSALLTVAVLLLSACGASYNAHPTPSVTLTYWYSGDQSYGPVIADIISKYEAFYPNVKVTAQYIAPDQEHDAYVAAAKSGTAPDLMSSNALWTQEFGSAGYLYDLSALEGTLTDFDKTRSNSVVSTNGLYGLPETSNLLVLYYNAAALAAKNSKVPATMQDFDAANKALTAAGKFGWEFSGDAYTAQVFMYAFGGGLANFKKSVLVESADTAGSAAGLTFLKQELQYAPPVDFTNGAANTLADFKSGKVAMIIGNSDSYKDILTGSAFSDPTNLGVIQIPTDQTTGAVARSPVNGQDVVIAAKSKNLASDFTFATYLTSQVSQVEIYQKLGLLSTRGSTQQNSALTTNTAFKAFVSAQIQTEFSPPFSKLGDAFYAPSSGIDAELQKFLTGKEDATAACTAMGASLTTLLGKTQ
jgi:ABC-type glycerol-3-phosphate transport system substrate-binding protein